MLILKETNDCRVILKQEDGREIVEKQVFCLDDEANNFFQLLQYLQRQNDKRLVNILSAKLTDDGYVYKMEYLPETLSRAQSKLVADYFWVLRGKKVSGPLAKLINSQPELVEFLEQSQDIYFDMVGSNLRIKDRQFKWIDLEGLEWSGHRGRIYLGERLVISS